MIAVILDNDITRLSPYLTWMPAHISKGAIGTRKKSNHREVTAVDYRANRLVDLLAKLGTQSGGLAEPG